MSHVEERTVTMELPRARVVGSLAVPPGAGALVVFAHGSGSSRLSPRNRFVAGVLQRAGLGTLLFDLLTPDEQREDDITGRLRFDIDFLSARMLAVTNWVHDQDDLGKLALGYFGASTGSAAALVSAAWRPEVVGAVVSRGGRPDLARDALEHVRAPTLLLVGSRDPMVLELNEQALRRMHCPRQLDVIPGATHLFEEPGTLEAVAERAASWFDRWLRPHAPTEATEQRA